MNVGIKLMPKIFFTSWKRTRKRVKMKQKRHETWLYNCVKYLSKYLMSAIHETIIKRTDFAIPRTNTPIYRIVTKRIIKSHDMFSMWSHHSSTFHVFFHSFFLTLLSIQRATGLSKSLSQKQKIIQSLDGKFDSDRFSSHNIWTFLYIFKNL